MKPRDKYAAEGLTARRQRVMAKSGRRSADDAIVARVAAALDETPTSASVFDDLWGWSGKSLVEAHSDRIIAALRETASPLTVLSAVGLDPNIAYSAADLCA